MTEPKHIQKGAYVKIRPNTGHPYSGFLLKVQSVENDVVILSFGDIKTVAKVNQCLGVRGKPQAALT